MNLLCRVFMIIEKFLSVGVFGRHPCRISDTTHQTYIDLENCSGLQLSGAFVDSLCMLCKATCLSPSNSMCLVCTQKRFITRR